MSSSLPDPQSRLQAERSAVVASQESVCAVLWRATARAGRFAGQAEGTWPAHHYHAPLLQVAIKDRNTLSIMWHLVQVLVKLEGL